MGSKRIFSVYADKNTGKYKIQYVENGVLYELDDYEFVSFPAADNFIKNNESALNARIDESNTPIEAEFEEVEPREETTTKKGKKNVKSKIIAYIAGLLTPIVLFFAGKGVQSVVSEARANAAITEKDDVDKTDDAYNSEENEYVLEEQTVEDIEGTILDISTEDEKLNTEAFTQIVTDAANVCNKYGLNVETQNITKFMTIVYSDELAEENKKLLADLTEVQKKEEFMSDVFRMISAVVGYDASVFGTEYDENLTNKFIYVSDFLTGHKKEQMLIIEEYINEMMEIKISENKVEQAYKNGSIESDEYGKEKWEHFVKMNTVIKEMIDALGDPASEIYKLDDGLGMAMQIYVALTINTFANNDLNVIVGSIPEMDAYYDDTFTEITNVEGVNYYSLSKENFDYLMAISDAEAYISNITAVYNGCEVSNNTKKNSVKTRTLTRRI